MTATLPPLKEMTFHGVLDRYRVGVINDHGANSTRETNRAKEAAYQELCTRWAAMEADLDRLTREKQEAEQVMEAKPFAEWGEDFGPALWWQYEVQQPPYCGSPLYDDWPFDDEDEEDGTLWFTPIEQIARAVNHHVATLPTPEPTP